MHFLPSHHPSHSTQPHYPSMEYLAGYSQNVTPHPTSDLMQSSVSPNQSPFGSEGSSVNACPAAPGNWQASGLRDYTGRSTRRSWVSGSGRDCFSLLLFPLASPCFLGVFLQRSFGFILRSPPPTFSHFVFYSWVDAPPTFSFS